jgi:hypothetical protein
MTKEIKEQLDLLKKEVELHIRTNELITNLLTLHLKVFNGENCEDRCVDNEIEEMQLERTDPEPKEKDVEELEASGVLPDDDEDKDKDN